MRGVPPAGAGGAGGAAGLASAKAVLRRRLLAARAG